MKNEEVKMKAPVTADSFTEHITPAGWAEGVACY